MTLNCELYLTQLYLTFIRPNNSVDISRNYLNVIMHYCVKNVHTRTAVFESGIMSTAGDESPRDAIEHIYSPYNGRRRKVIIAISKRVNAIICLINVRGHTLGKSGTI